VSNDSVEQILVVPTALFRRLGYFQGFSGDVARYLGELFSPQHTSFRPRPEVEQDPGFKQLIPYVIFQHGQGPQATVFQYTRGTGLGEDRLHRKRSVGVGGHISAADAVGPGEGSLYEQGMRRELEEEVRIGSPYVARCVGLINDDQSEVGRVHLGVVHVFQLQRPEVQPREPDMIECGFRPVAHILADMDGFETWSQICVRALFAES
jgi:predicted NUDIX family phosphoesterase